jgi:predicted metal-binding protein
MRRRLVVALKMRLLLLKINIELDLCSESVTMGSPNVDFFHQLRNDEAVEGGVDRLESMQGYRQREMLSDCAEDDGSDFGELFNTSAGLLEIMDGISSNMTLHAIATALENAIQLAGCTPLSPTNIDENLAFVVMEEGYVAGRVWPEQDYFGFDLHLWSNTHKMSVLRAGLADYFNKIPLSSLRVVVGGMNEVSGQPDVINSRAQLVECTKQTSDTGDSPGDLNEKVLIYTAAIDEVLSVVGKEEVVALVLCGNEVGSECLTSTILEKHKSVSDAIVLRTCSGIEDSKDPTEIFEKMNDCEKDTVNKILSRVPGKIEMVVIDGESSFPLTQVVNSIFSIPSYREGWLLEDHFVLSLASDPRQQSVNRNFLDRHRRREQRFLVASAEVVISGATKAFEVGIVYSGQDLVVEKVSYVEHKLVRSLKEHNFEVEVHKMQRGQFPFDAEFDPTYFQFYDDDIVSASQFIFSEEMTFGLRQIVRLAASDETGLFETSLEDMNDVAKLALTRVDFDFARFQHFQRQVGKSLVSTHSSKEATVIVVWDGLRGIDLTMFPSTLFDGVANIFLEALSEISEHDFQIVSNSHAITVSSDDYEA